MVNAGGTDEETWKKMSKREKRVYVFGIAAIMALLVGVFVCGRLGWIR